MDAQLIVKKAAQAFTSGQFDTALDLYKKAANTYGQAMFEVNITLCQRRLKNALAATHAEVSQEQGVSLEQQLQSTQQLLEYYYTRSQELESQLLDK